MKIHPGQQMRIRFLGVAGGLLEVVHRLLRIRIVAPIVEHVDVVGRQCVIEMKMRQRPPGPAEKQPFFILVLVNVPIDSQMGLDFSQISGESRLLRVVQSLLPMRICFL